MEWIKVKKFDPKELEFTIGEVSHSVAEKYNERYNDLLSHHTKETEFLINKCRELAKRILDGNKNDNAS